MKTHLRMLTIAPLGLTVALSAWAMTSAQDPKEGPAGRVEAHEPKPAADPAKAEAVQQLDKLLGSFQKYREKVGDINESTRKEIDRTAKDLVELTELRYQMMLQIAAIRGQVVSTSNSAASELEAREALQRELRIVHAQLRAEAEQARNQVAQVATQLQAYRDQLTRPKAEPGHAGSKPAEAPKPVVSGSGDPG